VDGSRQLARRLHDILRGDGRISPGDLVVGLYHTGVGEAAFPCLVLIKMNPGEVFRQDYVQGEDGRHRMKITLLDQVLPTERERLQKCACIRHTGQEYDMILLDRQIRSQAVARFFTEDFLKARLALDDGQRTIRFYDCVTGCHDAIRERLTSEEYEEVRMYIRHSMRRPTLDLAQWADELPLADPLKAEFRRALEMEVVDGGVEVDRATATRLLRNHQYLGSHGLKVQFDERFNLIREEKRVERPGEVPGWEITLFTETWVQKC